MKAAAIQTGPHTVPMMRCRSLLARTGFDSVLRKYDKDALAALFGLRESIEDSFTQVRRIAGVCPRLEQHFDKTTVPCPHSAVESIGNEYPYSKKRKIGRASCRERV